MDVYFRCDRQDPKWLGTVEVESATMFSIAAPERRCVEGLNFFLLVRSQEHGYWIGPVRSQGDTYVALVTQRYAAFSTARLRPDLR